MRGILLQLIFCFSCAYTFAQSNLIESKETYKAGELLVMFTPGADIDAFIKIQTVSGLSKISKISDEWNVWRIAYDTALTDAETARNKIAKDPSVKIVQFNHNHIPLKSNPNDTLFAKQWDMMKISAPQAWDSVSGGMTINNQQIVIATVDGGFDLKHPDLNYWKNTFDIPHNGIDDDSDGYVDDYNGWNTVWLNDSFPLINHGTFCTGISGAIGNNITGVAGVCWNVKEMPVATNENDEASVVSAYSYVFKQRQIYNQTNGAKGALVVVTNSSFGPAGYGYQYPLWNAMYDSLGSIGILSAGATSNNPNCDVDTCPDIPSQCASNYTIIVTGTDSNDNRHGGYGPNNVDIAAPGNGTFTVNIDSAYGNVGGTSAASPHVAGAIALMWSEACQKMLDDYKLYPDSLALVMKRYLLESVDTLPALVGKIVSGGRLNLYKAILKVKTYDCTMPATSVNGLNAGQENVRVYPNPVNDILKIVSPDKIVAVCLYNYLGQNLMSYENVSDIYVHDLLAGLYTVKVRDIKGNVFIQKVLKL